jgi:hypothetical protein
MIGYFENSSTGNKTTTTMRIWRRSFPRSWLRCSNIQEFNRAVIAYTAAAGGGDDAMPGCCWHDRTGTAMRQQAPGPRRLFLAPYRTLARAGSVSRVETTTIEAERQDAAAESRLPPRYSWCLSARTSVPHGVPTRLGALAAERTAEESPDHAAIRDAEQVDRGIQPPAAYLFARAHRARCPLGFGSAPTPSTRENPAARFAWPSRLPVDGGGRDHRTTLFSCVDHSLALMNRVRTDESPVAFDFSAAPGRGPTGWSFRSSLLWPPMMPTATATAMRVQGAGPPAGWTSGRVVHLGGNPVLRNRSPGGAQRRRCRLGNARLGRSTTMLMMDQPTTLQWTTARDEKNRFPSL